MLTNMTQRVRHHDTTYAVGFRHSDFGTWAGGYSFPSDAEGNIVPLSSVWARANLSLCIDAYLDGTMTMEIETYENSWTEPAHGTCPCGATVLLDSDYGHGHGIDCDGCNRIYSLGGTELAPRSQWDDRYHEDSTQPYWAEFGYAND